MVKATNFELKLWKFFSDYCFVTFMIDLRTTDTRDIRVKQIKRSFVAKCMVRISQATLFAMKLFSLVYRMSKDETSSYYFFHSHVMLYVTTGLYSATAVTTKSDEALAYFNLQHAVCKQFLGTCSIF